MTKKCTFVVIVGKGKKQIHKENAGTAVISAQTSLSLLIWKGKERREYS